MIEEFKKRYVFILFFSFFLSRIYINFGFAFKPFMWVSAVGLMLYRDEIILNLKTREFTSYEKIYLIFLIFYSFSIVFSKDYYLSIRYLLGLILMLGIYEINRTIMLQKQLDEIIEQAIFASLCGIALGFLSYLIGAYRLDFNYIRDKVRLNGLLIDRHNPRFIGFISHDPNIAFMTLTITFYLSLLSKNVYLNIFSIIAHLITMFLTYSRAGILSLFLSLIFYGLFVLPRLSRRQKIVVASFIGVMVLFFGARGNITWRIINRFKNLKIDGGSGRITLWKTGYLYYKNNILTGVGINNLKVYLAKALGRPAYLHSVHLEVLFEGGIITFIVYIFYHLTFTASFLKNRDNAVIRAVFFMMIAIVIQQSFLSTFLHESFFIGMSLYSSFMIKVKQNNVLFDHKPNMCSIKENVV